MKQPDREWIQKKLSRLTAHTDNLREVGDVSDEPTFGAWTALKLVSLTATIDVYTTIMASNDFDYYYIDAMSGSGVVNLTDRDDTLIGSPFIAGTVARQPFSKMYFIEKNDDRAEALRERLDYAVDEIDEFEQSRDDYIVFTGDANEILPTIPNRVRQEKGGKLYGINGKDGAHHLSFIDNERIDVKFDTIRNLAEKMHGDLLINYQESGLNREFGDIKNGKTDWDDFVAFFGSDQVKEMEESEDRFRFYLSQLQGIEAANGRRDYESLQIRGSANYSYMYRMIYAPRQSGEFMDFMKGQRRKIENITGDEIETVLDTMKGTATHLGLWEVNDDNSQSRLGEY